MQSHLNFLTLAVNHHLAGHAEIGTQESRRRILASPRFRQRPRNTAFGGNPYPRRCRETLPNAIRKGYREVDLVRVADFWLEREDRNLWARVPANTRPVRQDGRRRDRGPTGRRRSQTRELSGHRP